VPGRQPWSYHTTRMQECQKTHTLQLQCAQSGMITDSQRLKGFLGPQREISEGIPQLLWQDSWISGGISEKSCAYEDRSSKSAAYIHREFRECAHASKRNSLLKSSQNHSGQVLEKGISGLFNSQGVPALMLTPEICMPIPEGMSISCPDIDITPSAE